MNLVLMRLLVILALVALASLCTGNGRIGFDIIQQLFSEGQEARIAEVVFWQIRLPRTLIALMVGATLGLSGAALQGFVRNPLAEPGILGISSGAALGAVLAFYGGLATTVWLPLAGTGGALLVVLTMLLLAGKTQRTDVLVLAGVALASLSAALVSLVINLQPNPYALMDVMFWLMGSLANRSMEQVWQVAPIMLLGWWLLVWDRRSLALLSLGEMTAQSLGAPLRRMRVRLVIGTALAVGAAVALSGVIGFIGLIIPHVMRPLVQHDPARLLLPSAIGGALLLTLADIAVRLIPTNSSELKIGVLTALIGVPFFLWLVLHMRRREV